MSNIVGIEANMPLTDPPAWTIWERSLIALRSPRTTVNETTTIIILT